jgi:hypothetical protein
VPSFAISSFRWFSTNSGYSLMILLDGVGSESFSSKWLFAACRLRYIFSIGVPLTEPSSGRTMTISHFRITLQVNNAAKCNTNIDCSI